MSDDLKIERSYVDGVYTVVVTVENPGVLPTDIFLHENQEGELGDFFSVCTLETLSRPKLSEVPSGSNFGVRYVRYSSATKTFSDLVSAQEFEQAMVARVSQLYTQLTNNVDYVKIYPVTGA